MTVLRLAAIVVVLVGTTLCAGSIVFSPTFAMADAR